MKNNDKKAYQSPELNLVEFEKEDIMGSKIGEGDKVILPGQKFGF